MRKLNHYSAAYLTGLAVLAITAVGPNTAVAQNAHAKISAAQAKSAALKKYHGTVEGKIALENEEGKWQYAVNVRDGKTLREVMVDANTGKIANVEVTTKGEEKKEAQAEAAHAKKAQKTKKPAAAK